MAEAFYRLKSAGGAWTRATGTAPITVAGYPRARTRGCCQERAAAETWGGDPAQYPALIREARTPGVVTEWRQPLDQFDAYLTVDPFTGKPERVTHNGATYEAESGSAGGPGGAELNTWKPDEYGWTQV